MNFRPEKHTKSTKSLDYHPYEGPNSGKTCKNVGKSISTLRSIERKSNDQVADDFKLAVAWTLCPYMQSLVKEGEEITKGIYYGDHYKLRSIVAAFEFLREKLKDIKSDIFRYIYELE